MPCERRVDNNPMGQHWYQNPRYWNPRNRNYNNSRSGNPHQYQRSRPYTRTVQYSGDYYNTSYLNSRNWNAYPRYGNTNHNHRNRPPTRFEPYSRGWTSHRNATNRHPNIRINCSWCSNLHRHQRNWSSGYTQSGVDVQIWNQIFHDMALSWNETFSYLAQVQQEPVSCYRQSQVTVQGQNQIHDLGISRNEAFRDLGLYQQQPVSWNSRSNHVNLPFNDRSLRNLQQPYFSNWNSSNHVDYINPQEPDFVQAREIDDLDESDTTFEDSLTEVSEDDLAENSSTLDEIPWEDQTENHMPSETDGRYTLQSIRTSDSVYLILPLRNRPLVIGSIPNLLRTEGQDPADDGLSEETISNHLSRTYYASANQPADDGLSEETISSHLRTRTYYASANQENLDAVGNMDDKCNMCVICQMEYEDNDTLGSLQCGHEYHAHCIKRWLLEKNICPVCKNTAISGNNLDS